MGVFYEAVPNSLMEWIPTQKCFWVATAPLVGGHVNVSPKGGPYFGLVNNKQFWYLDLTGSGVETISHLHEPSNGRVTILFNAFDGPPKIVRLWGIGSVLEFDTPRFNDFVSTNNVEILPGTRSIILVDIHQVGSSCGFSVPFYDFKEFRPVLNNYMKQKEKKFLAGKEEESMPRYWALKNAFSVDGLPGMKKGLQTGDDLGIEPIKKWVGAFVPKNSKLYLSQSAGTFGLLHMMLFLLIGMLMGFAFATWGPEAQGRMRELVKPVLEGARTRITISIPSPAQILKR